jgi:hypothetical protein
MVKMQRLIMICLATVTGSLVGCNQPAVTLKLPAFQASENTVRDWNDVAHRIGTSMAAIGLLPAFGQSDPGSSSSLKPAFVRVQSPDSAFIREVANELVGDILRRGGIVARTPAGATVVNLDVNVVRWGPRDKPPGLLGTMTAIATTPAIVIGASLPMSTWVAADAAAATSIGLGVAADGIIALTPTTNAEAIWEATIITSDRVVMKLQEPIYIRAPDISLYAKATNLSPMVSWSNNEPLRSRLIRYDP